jgi:phosphoribosylanthranilate isomerase
MTWIKICGTTNVEDAQMAVEAGADALGFVFYKRSPRTIDAKTVQGITANLPARVEKVGVFVEQTIEEIAEICKTAGLTAVQVCKWNGGSTLPITELSSRHSYRIFLSIPGNNFKASDLSGIFSSKELRDHITALLLDSATPESPGGTGKTFDWDNARNFVQALGLQVPIIVAGGLTPLNVTRAVKLFQPYGVDVASGVEARPGKKDPEKVWAFIQAVRAAEKTN